MLVPPLFAAGCVLLRLAIRVVHRCGCVKTFVSPATLRFFQSATRRSTAELVAAALHSVRRVGHCSASVCRTTCVCGDDGDLTSGSSTGQSLHRTIVAGLQAPVVLGSLGPLAQTAEIARCALPPLAETIPLCGTVAPRARGTGVALRGAIRPPEARVTQQERTTMCGSLAAVGEKFVD